MLKAHPYEEPAYDLFCLIRKQMNMDLDGLGNLNEKMTLAQFAEHVKDVFNVPAVRFVGDPNKEIKKVAVLGGDGNKYIYAAKRSGADVLVTGDLYYHVAHDAEAIGLAVVDPGHNIEKVMIEGVADYMQTACEEAGIMMSEFHRIRKLSTEPFHFI